MPIGYIQVFMNNTNPNNIYTGTTWELIKEDVYIGNDTTTTESPASIAITKLGDILGQDSISVVGNDNSVDICMFRNWEDKFDNYTDGSKDKGEHAYNFARNGTLKISNEVPHILVKVWNVQNKQK